MISDTSSNQHAPFLNLPTEIQIQILKYCPYHTLKELLVACKAVKVILETHFDRQLFRPSAEPISMMELDRLWDSHGAGMIDWHPLLQTHRWNLDWSWQLPGRAWLGELHYSFRVYGFEIDELPKQPESATNPPLFGLSMGAMTHIIDKSASNSTITVRDFLEGHVELCMDLLDNMDYDYDAWLNSSFKVRMDTIFKEDDHLTVKIERLQRTGAFFP
ncbi:hypothetical protein CF319_g7041 [Tilletia indica]|nr:hypothetical protein CF319_g7041 [Tilletia indica]